MKRFGLFLSLCLFACQAFAAPGLVSYATISSQLDHNTTLRWIPLPNGPALSGNLIIVGWQAGGLAPAPTITDDGASSPSYTLLCTTTDTVNGQTAGIAYRTNVTNAPTRVKITFTAPGTNFVSAMVSEWYNYSIASPVDTTTSPAGGCAGTFNTSNAPSPGNMTTTTAGDLIVSYAFRDDSATPQIVSWTQTSPNTLIHADRETAQGGEYRIQAAAGTVSQNFSWDASYGWVAVEAAFKAGTDGTAPTAVPRVVGVHHQGMFFAGSSATTYVFNCPMTSVGNMVYAAYIGLHDISSITSSPANTWTATGASVINGGSGFVRGFYVTAASTTSVMTVTLTLTGAAAVPGDTIFMYEVAGMDASTPFDAHGTLTGTTTGAGSITGASVTATTGNGVVFSTFGITSNSITSDTSPGYFQSSTDPTEEFSPWPNDENNGWAWYNNPNAASIANVWISDGSADAWASIADAFKSSAPSSGSVCMRRLLKVGC